MLGDGTCHSSIGLVILKLGLRPSLIFNKKSLLFLDLDVGALDLSIVPASFLMRNHYCFWTWMSEHWTCPFEAGPKFILNKKSLLFLDLSVGALDLSF